MVLRGLREAGFTINPDKFVIAAEEIKYLGLVLYSRGTSVLPDRVAAIKAYPRSTNLRLGDSLGRPVFTPGSFRNILSVPLSYMR